MNIPPLRPICASSIVECFSNRQQLDCWGSIDRVLSFFQRKIPAEIESLKSVARMPEAREEDEIKQVFIPLKNVLPTIPYREAELKELIEDLTRMGCEGILSKPWGLRSEATLREFLFERGNQWFWTIRQDPEKWTTEV